MSSQGLTQGLRFSDLGFLTIKESRRWLYITSLIFTFSSSISWIVLSCCFTNFPFVVFCFHVITKASFHPRFCAAGDIPPKCLAYSLFHKKSLQHTLRKVLQTWAFRKKKTKKDWMTTYRIIGGVAGLSIRYPIKFGPTIHFKQGTANDVVFLKKTVWEGLYWQLLSMFDAKYK